MTTCKCGEELDTVGFIFPSQYKKCPACSRLCVLQGKWEKSERKKWMKFKEENDL